MVPYVAGILVAAMLFVAFAAALPLEAWAPRLVLAGSFSLIGGVLIARALKRGLEGQDTN